MLHKNLMRVSVLFFSLLRAQAIEYDYIVVGSGPGGGTVATELALKNYQVLLIEAGPDHFEANQVTPIFHGRASEDSNISFDFEVQHYTNGRGYFYPRASVLGGCSLHNAQIAVYPNSEDFEYMQEVTGDSGWSERNIRNYFMKMERNQYPASFLFSAVTNVLTNRFLNNILPVRKLIEYVLPPLVGHGYRGWFPTSFIDLLRQLKIDTELLDVLIAELGNVFIDVNGYSLLGKLNTDHESSFFVPQSVHTEQYTRFDFPGYIKSVADQGYLTVMTDTFVTKVLIDENNKAYGVEYRKGRFLYRASPSGNEESRQNAPTGQVYAKKEIILSGGTFNTPQILMLSGIGDEDQLQLFDIPIKQHLPGVGRNMMDRYELSVVNKYPKKFKLLEDCLLEPSLDDPCYEEFIEKHSGPYISNGVLTGEIKSSQPDLKSPDLFILSTFSDFHGYFHGYSKVLAERFDSFTRAILKAHTNNTNGFVRLQSTDPFDTPEINFKYFSDGDHDLNILINEIKEQRAFVRKRIHLPHEEIIPGPQVQSDEQIRDFIIDQAWGHHACCTARMGQDDTAVLDSKFRVRGIQNLRVVDASALPKIPGYFPALFIHLMAMKAADDIALSS